jgi:hypothetical protein
MVATSRTAAAETADSALEPDLVAEVAALRARAASWEDAAAKVHWDVSELRRALRHDPTYEAAYARAEREVGAEAEGEALATLRRLMAEGKPAAAKAAAKIVLDHAAQRRADQTKLEIEHARITARAGSRRDDGAEDEEACAEPTEEDKRQWEAEMRKAASEFAPRAKVYLWGGCHRTDAPPDGTDTELSLRAETSLPGRPFYWAVVTRLLGRDPRTGPFLPPPGCKPNDIPIYTG